MQARWGNYFFPINGAEVTNRTYAEISPQGLPLRYVSRYTVVATLLASGQLPLSALEIQVRNVLAIPRQDFALITDTGVVSSAAILNRDTLSGTRITRVDFPEAMGGEFVNRRTVSFDVEAVYLIANAANAVISWRESVTIQGNGGPRRVWRYPINAPGIRQVISPTSPVIATQSGQAVGHLARPHPPLPYFPQYIVNEAFTQSTDSPELLGQAYINYPVSWSYRFERGDGPLLAIAGLPPGVL